MKSLILVFCLLHLNRFRVTTSSTVCRDISTRTRCLYHLQNCQTSSEVRYYCRKSCGLCGCRDRSFNCLHNIKFCKSYKDVQYYCPKSCGLCGTTTHSPTITKLGTTTSAAKVATTIKTTTKSTTKKLLIL